MPLDAAVHPTCARYIGLLSSLAAEEYYVLAASVWAIEYTYNQAWQVTHALCLLQRASMGPTLQWKCNSFTAHRRCCIKL